MIINRRVLKDGNTLILTYSDKNVWIKNINILYRDETYCEAIYPKELSGLYSFEETNTPIPNDISIPTQYDS